MTRQRSSGGGGSEPSQGIPTRRASTRSPEPSAAAREATGSASTRNRSGDSIPGRVLQHSPPHEAQRPRRSLFSMGAAGLISRLAFEGVLSLYPTFPPADSGVAFACPLAGLPAQRGGA